MSNYCTVCHRQEGFTLVELMMAIFVLSLLLGMAFTSVNSLSGVSRFLDKEEAALLATQKAMNILSRDIAGAVGLELVDNGVQQSLLRADDSFSEQMQLFNLTTADGERFSYVFSSGGLFRQSVFLGDLERVTDEAANEIDSLRLLDDLLSASLTYPDVEGFSGQSWVQLTLEHEQLGVMRRIINYAQLSADVLKGVNSLQLSLSLNQTQIQMGSSQGPQAVTPQTVGNTKADDFDW